MLRFPWLPVALRAYGGVVTAAAVLAAVPTPIAAQTCHTPAVEAPAGPVSAAIVAETATFDRGGGDAGNYQGISARVNGRLGGLAGSLLVPMYRLDDRAGGTSFGLGDLLALGEARLYRASQGRLSGGALLGVTAPTGSRERRLGMGHVMVMPGVWTTLAGASFSSRLDLGYGRVLGSRHAGHHQGGHARSGTSPVVSPMNQEEVTATLAVETPLRSWLTAGVSGSGAWPVRAPGTARGVASFILRLPEVPLAPWAAVQVPLAGDPFGIRFVAAMTFGGPPLRRPLTER